jgi:hypothetical protein
MVKNFTVPSKIELGVLTDLRYRNKVLFYCLEYNHRTTTIDGTRDYRYNFYPSQKEEEEKNHRNQRPSPFLSLLYVHGIIGTGVQVNGGKRSNGE